MIRSKSLTKQWLPATSHFIRSTTKILTIKTMIPMEESTSKRSATTLTTSSTATDLEIRLPVPEEGKTALLQIDNTVPVAENGDFLKGMTMMMAEIGRASCRESVKSMERGLERE